MLQVLLTQNAALRAQLQQRDVALACAEELLAEMRAACAAGGGSVCISATVAPSQTAQASGDGVELPLPDPESCGSHSGSRSVSSGGSSGGSSRSCRASGEAASSGRSQIAGGDPALEAAGDARSASPEGMPASSTGQTGGSSWASCSASGGEGRRSSFDELRRLTAQLQSAPADGDIADLHATALQRQLRRYQQHMPGRGLVEPPHNRPQQAPAERQPDGAPPTAQSAWQGRGMDGEDRTNSGGGGSGGSSDAAAATLAEIAADVQSLCAELAAAAGAKYTSASALSSVLQGAPPSPPPEHLSPEACGAWTAASAAAAAASTPEGARSRDVRHALRRARAVASGLQVDSAAELGAARAAAALQRRVLSLQDELSGLLACEAAADGRRDAGGLAACSASHADASEGADEEVGDGGAPAGQLLAAFDRAAVEAGRPAGQQASSHEVEGASGSGGSAGTSEERRLQEAPPVGAAGDAAQSGAPQVTCSALLRMHHALTRGLRAVQEEVAIDAAASFSSGGTAGSGGSSNDSTRSSGAGSSGAGGSGAGGSGADAPECGVLEDSPRVRDSPEASPGRPGPAGSSEGSRGSFAFGAVHALKQQQSDGGAASISVSFSFAGSSRGGSAPQRGFPRPPRSLRLQRVRGGGEAGRGSVSRDTSPAFETPAWLQRLSGRSDAATQTGPGQDTGASSTGGSGAEAVQRAAALEGRLLLVHQQLADVEVRAAVLAEDRDWLQVQLANAKTQLAAHAPRPSAFGENSVIGSRADGVGGPYTSAPGPTGLPPPSPRSRGPSPDLAAAELRERVARQAARIEQLQLALAAATACPVRSGSQGSGSLGSIAGGCRSHLGSASAASTPAKSPAAPGSGTPGSVRRARPPLFPPLPLQPLFTETLPQQSPRSPLSPVLGSAPASPAAAAGLGANSPPRFALAPSTAADPNPPGVASPGPGPAAGSPVWGLDVGASSAAADVPARSPPPSLGPFGSQRPGATAGAPGPRGAPLRPAHAAPPVLTARSTGTPRAASPLLSPRCTMPQSPGAGGGRQAAGR